MLASELIAALCNIVKDNGDMDVYLGTGENFGPVLAGSARVMNGITMESIVDGVPMPAWCVVEPKVETWESMIE